MTDSALEIPTEEPAQAARFAALGNPLRLAVFRYVIAAGCSGRSAGNIAEALGVPPSTLSSHLRLLNQCGLLDTRRDGQRIYYAVRPDSVQALVHFLLADCCQGNPALCGVTLPE